MIRDFHELCGLAPQSLYPQIDVISDDTIFWPAEFAPDRPETCKLNPLRDTPAQLIQMSLFSNTGIQ
jgi:hypothetical protein